MGCSSSVHAAPPSSPDAEHTGSKQPVTPDSRLLRGQAYYAAGRTDEALKELNATIATWPNYARAYLERGNVRLDQKDYTLALGDYNKALALQGNLLQGYVMRCHAHLALQRFPEALQDAREAEKLDPENAQVKALKAQVRKAQAAAAAAAAAAVAPSGGSTISGSGDSEDAFAGVDTPKSTPSPSVRKLCMVCMDAERECRLRPCFHAALCVGCAEGLMARGYGCPICSAKIEQVERGSFMRTFTVEEAQGLVASARVGASPAPSPGKSPLGRRALHGATGAPSPLEHIAEVDEEAHEAADATAAAAAAAALPSLSGTGSRGSSAGGGGGSVRPPTPPELEPHPLAARSSNTARAAAAATTAAMPASGSEVAAAAPPPPPPSLPGAVEDVGEVRAEGAHGGAVAVVVAAPPPALLPSPGEVADEGTMALGGGGGGTAAEAEEDAAAAAAAGSAGDDGSDGGSGDGGGGDGHGGTDSDDSGEPEAAGNVGEGVVGGADSNSAAPGADDRLRLSGSDDGGAAAGGSGGGGGDSRNNEDGGAAASGSGSGGGGGDARGSSGEGDGRSDGREILRLPKGDEEEAAESGASVVAAGGCGDDGGGGDGGSGGEGTTMADVVDDATVAGGEHSVADGGRDSSEGVDGGLDHVATTDTPVVPIDHDDSGAESDAAAAPTPDAALAAAAPPPEPTAPPPPPAATVFAISRVGSVDGGADDASLDGPDRLGSGSGVVSPGTSAHLAHSLADWIDARTDVDDEDVGGDDDEDESALRRGSGTGSAGASVSVSVSVSVAATQRGGRSPGQPSDDGDSDGPCGHCDGAAGLGRGVGSAEAEAGQARPVPEVEGVALSGRSFIGFSAALAGAGRPEAGAAAPAAPGQRAGPVAEGLQAEDPSCGWWEEGAVVATSGNGGLERRGAARGTPVAAAAACASAAAWAGAGPLAGRAQGGLAARLLGIRGACGC